MDKFKVSTRLNILLALAASAFIALTVIYQVGIRHLGELQDSGYKRSSESAEVQVAANIGPLLYRVIADAIINRNLSESAKSWAAIKAQAENMLTRAQAVADTPEEKKNVEKAKNSYRELISTYEVKLQPLLAHADADIKQIRALDNEIDQHVHAIGEALMPVAKSLSAEAAESDTEFDATRSSIILYSLITAFALLAAMILTAIMISKSIIRQLGGEPNYAMEVSRRIAAGDLASEIQLAGAHQDSLMASMQLMQKQLAKLIGQIHASSNQLTASAEELAAASSQVSARSMQQSDDTASVSAAIEELTVSIDSVASNAQEASHIASDSRTRSDEGAHQVKDATDEMAVIAQTVNETSAQMTTLSEQSQKISSIANVIKEVADQTNLLALNAAIEAARAGEQGRGFAVVADEVRKLAERTTVSAKEISLMITSIQEHTEKGTITMQKATARVSNGLLLAEKAEDSMRQISDASSGVVQAVSGISTSLQEQRVASGEIAKRVESIAQTTEENSIAVSTVAATAGQLKSMASDLKQAVSEFRV